MVKGRLVGVPDLAVSVRALSGSVELAGACLVDVVWDKGPGVLCELVDWVDGVRVMDPDGEDDTVEVSLRYIQARPAALSPRDSWNFALMDP